MKNLDTQEYNETIEKYGNMIYRLAFLYTNSKYDAEDIYQNVFLKYLQNEKTFESEEHKKAWLLRVTINDCKKIRLLSWNKKVVSLDDEIENLKSDDINDANNVTTDKLEFYQKLEKLPKKYKIVIHLFYYEQYSIKDISKLLKEKESTIRTRLTRARKIIKEDMERGNSYV